ncbi:hypothetical protein ACFWPU_45925 [Streptomyces sp. NPDC058471]|uniref:hypothetical protein n=1 Tax=Streptomyces sp. NPDC058471 TaxID=3346516 RepID=UPI00364F2864
MEGGSLTGTDLRIRKWHVILPTTSSTLLDAEGEFVVGMGQLGATVLADDGQQQLLVAGADQGARGGHVEQVHGQGSTHAPTGCARENGLGPTFWMLLAIFSGVAVAFQEAPVSRRRPAARALAEDHRWVSSELPNQHAAQGATARFHEGTARSPTASLP